MKLLAKLMDSVRPHFEEGGALKALRPIFIATDAFFLSSPEPTECAPHVRDPLDVKRYMSMVIIALLPCVIASVYLFGLRVLAMILVSYIAGGLVEVAFAMIRKEEINEGFLVTGLIFPLILPPSLPLWIVAVGVMFGVLVGKELFGGTGRNLFNPALLGRCFLALSYPAAMAGNWIKPGEGLTGRFFQYVDSSTVDAVSSATPLGLAKLGTLTPLRDLFLGNVAGSAGETSALAIILGGLFLIFVRVANWRTVVSCLGTFLIAGFILQGLYPKSYGPLGLHFLAGGLLFGAFFMATDPVTSPVTNGGKWAYGCLIGLVVLLIRNLTGYVEGVMFAVLLGNIFAPIFDDLAIKCRLRRLADAC